MESFEWQAVLLAFGLTVFAGLSTGIGSAFAFFSKKIDVRFLSGALGFSAGVMIYVSMIEIFPKARQTLESVYGATTGYWYTTLAFFGGIAVMALIDKLVPGPENPHEARGVEDMHTQQLGEDNGELLRMGIFSALAIAIHNFPEGLATFISALDDPALGVSIAVAVAIHNIPEGISVSVPIYYSTGSKRQAFKYSFLSGLAEPLGAIVGFTVLRPFISDTLFGITFASVAGIMVYISLDELLPTAEKYAEHHIAIWGLISGMAVMALSLLLLA
ncbi:zinc transporter ZupT [Atopococcus tabaci]|uniref:zinc transporter ZupT n=1 Tax=Atopococcus tabaci TaxID=269774 RepID=UPI00240A6D33|nr:zinc transporter ZupT [Atopococcus tabaci]